MGNLEIFDRMASEYDTPERINLAEIAAEKIRKILPSGKEKTAIDFGCGTGLVGLYISDMFSDILLLDSSQNMVNEVNKKIKSSGIKNAKGICADLETERKNINTADYVIAVNVLLHIENTEDILIKLYELVNPDGHLLIVDFDKNPKVISDLVHNGFEQEVLMNLLKKIGFREAKSETFYTGTKIFMNEDASMFVIDAKK